MYQVSYDKTMKKEVPDEKLIEFIRSLHEEYQKSKPQVVVITKDFTRLNIFMSPYGYIAYSKSTIISFQDVLKEIQYFSENHTLSKNMMWHAY